MEEAALWRSQGRQNRQSKEAQRPAHSRDEAAPDSHGAMSEGRARSARWVRAILKGQKSHIKQLGSILSIGEGQIVE